MNRGISPSDLLDFVITPTLKNIRIHSKRGALLVLSTCAQESGLGYYLRQIKGPALGIYQIEPNTHKDIYENFLRYRPELLQKIEALSRFKDYKQRENELITNLEYATAIARIIYYRCPEPLPGHEDVNGMAFYWKKYYNTVKGKGTVNGFVQSYQSLIKGKINEF